ncbi:MAG: WHG domain-containing protein [Bacteroides sp.]|nr:WHG domain-containing protein [Bacteroides sp.]
MPPKSKFTKEEIVAAAFKIASEEGISSVTARAVGAKLNSSARPIFTVFHSMDDLIREVILAARALYNEYIKEGLREEIRFKGVGTQYIKFAIEHPKLFQILFMSERDDHLTINSIPAVDDNYDDILSSITNQYGLDRETALSLYRHLWVYTHGIASLCATKTLEFKSEEISEMMTDVFVSLLIKKKSETNAGKEERK